MRAPQLRPVVPLQFTFGSFFKTAFLPGILPNLQRLAGAVSRFMFVFTQVFGMTGLIDRHHPCMQPQNIGRYRFVDIVGLAYYNMMQDRKNLNKVLMFIVSILSILFVIAFTISAFLFLMTLIPKAHAQFFSDSQSVGYDVTQDFAYQFLDEVFGNVGISLWGGAGTQDKNILFGPIIREMFSTYSQALLIIAVFMIIYHIVVMVAESARTGEPFGENFNSVWAPIRLTLAIGLLVPISNGYNGAQLIAFQVSNWGSALATNVWNSGLESFGGVTINDQGQMVATQGAVGAAGQKLIMAMQPVNGYRFMRGLFMIKLCEEVLNRSGTNTVMTGSMSMISVPGPLVSGLIVADDEDWDGMYYNHQVGTYYNTFGQAMLAANLDYCGSYKVPDKSEFTPRDIALIDGSNEVVLSKLSHEIAKGYTRFYNKVLGQPIPGDGILDGVVDTIVDVVSTPIDATAPIPAAVAKIRTSYGSNPGTQTLQQMMTTETALSSLHDKLISTYRGELGYCPPPPGYSYGGCNEWNNGLYFQSTDYQDAAKADAQAVILILNSGKKHGWASAGSVMMTLAEANNLVSSAVNTPPVITSLPRLMTNPAASPFFRNESVSSDGFFMGIYNWFFGGGLEETVKNVNTLLAKANTWFVDSITYNDINTTHNVRMSEWNGELKDRAADNQTDTDIMSAGGFQSLLLSMVYMNNADMNPLAQVVAIGNGLTLVAGSLVAAGILIAIFVPGGSSIFDTMFSLAVPLFLGAYMLTVMLPFMLFMNFMFAVIEWIMSVFEAVIGMPLFALSFITISGDGIGDKAMGGVMKLFELMLRPTVIVIATVGAMIIFSGSVHFFNRTFSLFMSNYYNAIDSTITNPLVVIGSIFLYVMTVYSLGNSCFKMIPAIANQFMGWIGGPEGFSSRMNADMDKAIGYAAVAGAFSVAKGVGSLASGAKKRSDDKKDKKEKDKRQNEEDMSYLNQKNISLDGPNQQMDSDTYERYSRAQKYRNPLWRP
jgi:hypothetical protein